MSNILDKILGDVSLDFRIDDGIFNIKNNQHIEYLCEYLINYNINEDVVLEFVEPLMEKGKHPERQAYNKNGLLVTFPTPEYKARALARGTHFEKDPKAAQSNLFGGGQQAPNQPTTAPSQGTAPMDAGQSALPKSDSNQPQTPPAQKEVPDPGTPGTLAAPPPAPSSNLYPATQTPAQGQLAVEPTPATNTTPQNVATPAPAPVIPPIQKTPQEINVEKNIIKQMLNTDDTLPTVPGVGGSGMAENVVEQLKRLAKIAIDMNLNEAVKFLSKHI